MDCRDYCLNNTMELRELIEEQRIRLGALHQNVDALIPYYTYGSNEFEYFEWVERAKRYIEQTFHGDKHIDEFYKTCNEKLTLKQQMKLLAILEAFEKYPKVIENSKATNRAGDINIHNNISNTNTQSQSQQQGIEILIKALGDQLSVSQLKEIKQVVEEAKGDLEKAKPKLIDKIKSFGGNVASNILANLITNPTIWALLG